MVKGYIKILHNWSSVTVSNSDTKQTVSVLPLKNRSKINKSLVPSSIQPPLVLPHPTSDELTPALTEPSLNHLTLYPLPTSSLACSPPSASLPPDFTPQKLLHACSIHLCRHLPGNHILPIHLVITSPTSLLNPNFVVNQTLNLLYRNLNQLGTNVNVDTIAIILFLYFLK